MNRNGPNRMNTLMNSSSGSCTNTSPSWGSVSGGKIWRSPANGWKKLALTPANENSSWQSPSSSRMNAMRIGSRRNFERQYQWRRRAMRSSCLSDSSAPNRLGHGISLRAITSTSPRKTTTARTVMMIDAASDRWFESYRTRKKAGAVRRATAVAALVRRRHSNASADASGFMPPLKRGLCSA